MSLVGPLVLLIIDGYGYNASTFGNAIATARTPVMDMLTERWPHTLVAASGEAVGLPPGQQGNSEVGHLTIGAGRVIFQPLSRITRAVEDGSFLENPVLIAAVDAALRRGTALHLLGLVSPGGVHSHQDHALAICDLAHRRGLDRVYVHAMTDGRDEPPSSAAECIRQFELGLTLAGAGRVASVSGRYFAMDRDERWDRVEFAYQTIIGGANPRATGAAGYVEAEYAQGRSDEFILPAALVGADSLVNTIADGDSVIFFNFRPDRARQLSHALTDRKFAGFVRSRVPRDLHFVTFTEYAAGLPAHVAFPRENVVSGLAEVVSAAGKSQFHVAETEKYAHVTYFVNGGREEPFTGEQRLLVPSPKVATYDLAPAMGALAVTDQVVARLGEYSDALVIINYANPDMVGHTGVLAATVEAVEVVDSCIGRVVEAALASDGAVLITSDHGNAEHKINPADNSPLTAHTTAPVPVVLCGAGASPLRDGGGLSDVAPTVLDVLGIAQPEVMTGRSLRRR
ncbi:MAG: 2,3-bisphosphoglycerate-independent phosphoglycerate mutase [Candidatus Dormibacteria bacterium]